MRTWTNSCCMARRNLVYRSDRRQDRAHCSATYCSATTDSKLDSQNNSIQNLFSCGRIKIFNQSRLTHKQCQSRFNFEPSPGHQEQNHLKSQKSHIETQLFCMPIAHKPNTKTANTHARRPNSHGPGHKSTRVLSKSKAQLLSLFPQVSIDIDNFSSPDKSWP